MIPTLEDTVMGSHDGRTTISSNQSSKRGTTVIILEPDGTIHRHPPSSSEHDSDHATLYVPSEMVRNDRNRSSFIDRLMGMALDLVGARTVEMRVYEEAGEL